MIACHIVQELEIETDWDHKNEKAYAGSFKITGPPSQLQILKEVRLSMGFSLCFSLGVHWIPSLDFG
jgi:hypothetical protein